MFFLVLLFDIVVSVILMILDIAAHFYASQFLGYVYNLFDKNLFC